MLNRLILLLVLLSACTKREKKGENHIPTPPQNPLTTEGVDLGSILFKDPILSSNGKTSCATCHNPDRVFTSARSRTATRSMDREIPSLFNLAWSPSFFGDGREKNLESLVIKPIQNENEMNSDLNLAVKKLNESEQYPGLFRKAFGSDSIYSALVARALSQYIRSLVRPEPLETTLSDAEKKGKKLFDLHCRSCHKGSTSSDFVLRKSVIAASGPDSGRFHLTHNIKDVWVFKTPSLAGISQSSPYSHSGKYMELKEVVQKYAILLPAKELEYIENQQYLVAFLKRL